MGATCQESYEKNVLRYLAFVKSKELFIKRAQSDVLQKLHSATSWIMQILYGEAHQKQIYYELKDSKREHAE